MIPRPIPAFGAVLLFCAALQTASAETRVELRLVQVQAPGKEPPPPLTPLDMEEILRRRLERSARLIAD